MQQAQQAATGSLVGVREAARQLGVNASTVSRQLGRVFRNHGTSQQPLIDVEEARAARARHLDPMKQNRFPAPLADAPAAPERIDAEPALAGARRRKVELEIEEKELELAARKRDLVDRSEIDALWFELAALIEQKLAARNHRLGELLAAMTDPRLIAAKLDDEDRALLDGVAGEAERRVKGLADEAL